MMVYHGSYIEVRIPDVSHSLTPLDFGPGFYVTRNMEQAVRWAKRKADQKGAPTGKLNSYEMTDVDGFNILDFGDNMDQWIDFVCACRDGSDIYAQYDVIKGKVADDRVFRVVDMYKRGIWDRERAIKEMRAYENYDQVAFITQPAIDAMLHFKDCIEVTL